MARVRFPAPSVAVRARTTARRAANVAASLFDIAAADLFRRTRGAASESLIRQIWASWLHAECPERFNPLTSLSLNSVGKAVGRDRSTAGHASDLIEDLRNEETCPLELGRALAFVLKPDPKAPARHIAAMVAAHFDIGQVRMFRGRDPDEVMARRFLFALLRQNGILTAEIMAAGAATKGQIAWALQSMQAVRTDPYLRAVYNRLQAHIEHAAELRAALLRLAEKLDDPTAHREAHAYLQRREPGEWFDLWLDDAATLLRSVLAVGRDLDSEIHDRLKVAIDAAPGKRIPSTQAQKRAA